MRVCDENGRLVKVDQNYSLHLVLRDKLLRIGRYVVGIYAVTVLVLCYF